MEKKREKDKNKDKDKDKEKKLSALRKKIESLEGAYSALQDGECSLTRLQDGSFRMILKEGDRSAIDAEGHTMMELSEILAKCFARIQFMSERMELGLQVHYIDPEVHLGYQKHKTLQDQLESQYRRLLSAEGRIAAAEKKEKDTGTDSSQQKQAEIDKLKAELSSMKDMTMKDFRKLYEENGPTTPGGGWSKGRGRGKGSDNGKAGNKNAADGGGGGGGGGGKGKKGGRRRGRGKGGGGGGKNRRGK